MENKKQNSKVIDHPKIDDNPIDYMISIHIRNMYATYGEEKVKNSLKELFNLEYKPKKRKAA